LELEMGPKPNESWGSARDELPPRNFLPMKRPGFPPMSRR